MSNWMDEHKERPAAFVSAELTETHPSDLTETGTTDLMETKAAELKAMDTLESKATGATVVSVFESAFCGSLRSKKFFMRDGLLATEAGDYLDASNHCWCRETHQVIGPDGGRAQPARCVSGRSCYNSALKG
jgi:hypothetical protein